VFVFVRDIGLLVLLATCMLPATSVRADETVAIRPDETAATRPDQMARLVLDQRDRDPLVLTVQGERIKSDGRLRFVGSVDRPEGGLLVHWNLVCDPNPNGEASIEGTYEIVGPFDGSIRLDLPLNPVIDGPVALKTSAVMRAKSDAAGVAISIPSNDCAWSVVVDGRFAVRHGSGPFSIERRSAGVTKARHWSVGEDDRSEPEILPQAHDSIGIRSSCVLEPGCSVVFDGKVRMVGDPSNFQYRDEVERGLEDSFIPRRSGSISIIVPGTGSGGRSRTNRPNKQPAVVRPSKPAKKTEQ
jgi:hypothetical protein